MPLFCAILGFSCLFVVVLMFLTKFQQGEGGFRKKTVCQKVICPTLLLVIIGHLDKCIRV